MRNYIKNTVFLLAVLVLLGLCCNPGVVATAQTPVNIETVSQQITCDPITLELITETVTVQPVNVVKLDVYHETVADAAAQLRQGLKNREMVVTVGLHWNSADQTLMRQILDEAFRHTGVPTEGDYLLRHYGGSQIEMGGYREGSEFYLYFTYNMLGYYTTAQQEAEVDAAVAALLEQLDVWEASDYEKVKAIYDYICSHVTYDYAGLSGTDPTTYSAWKALIKGTSVCQGYANLFYRLALELGVDARIISGDGGGPHGWNIVRLDGKYYNVDATWDSQRVEARLEYKYFLCSPDNFTDHIRDEEYDTQVFHAQYPMGDKNYDPAGGSVLIGDMNSDSVISDQDAMYLLRFTLFGEVRYPLPMSGDVNSDGVISDLDAMYLLRFTLFGPVRYPLYP